MLVGSRAEAGSVAPPSPTFSVAVRIVGHMARVGSYNDASAYLSGICSQSFDLNVDIADN